MRTVILGAHQTARDGGDARPSKLVCPVDGPSLPLAPVDAVLEHGDTEGVPQAGQEEVDIGCGGLVPGGGVEHYPSCRAVQGGGADRLHLGVDPVQPGVGSDWLEVEPTSPGRGRE